MNYDYFPKNKYSACYIRLIESRKFQKKGKAKTEAHHIFLVSIYGDNEFKVKNAATKANTTQAERSAKFGNNIGNHWITDGVNSKCVNKDADIPEGFRKGRTIVRINKDITNN